MVMAITLRQLEVFLAVAEEQNFGRAAERLYVSQPSVSKEVRNLEQTLRSLLLVRTSRGAVLTEDGRFVVERAAEILANVHNLEETMLDSGNAPKKPRTITIAASPSIVDYLLPQIFSNAETSLPRVELVDLQVETGEVAQAVAQSDGDVGLGHFVSEPTGVRRLAIGQDEVLGVLSVDHPAAAGGALDLADVSNLPLLMWPRERNPAYFDFLIRVCEASGPRPYILTAPPRVIGVRSYFLTEGRAFTLVAAGSVSRIGAGLRALPLRDPAHLPLHMVWRFSEESDPSLRLVRRLIKKIVDGKQQAPGGCYP